MPGSDAWGYRRNEASDETLMARYADGDAEAFGELLSRYEARAYGFFFKRTGSRERAQDLYQDLFLRIHRARDSYDPTRAFAPWLFRFAHRLLADDYCRAYRTREVSLGDDEPRSATVGAEETIAQREYLDRLLDSLSLEERHIVVGSKLEGLGYSELALQLGKSADAVKKMASRALQRLRASAWSPGARGALKPL